MSSCRAFVCAKAFVEESTCANGVRMVKESAAVVVVADVDSAGARRMRMD